MLLLLQEQFTSQGYDKSFGLNYRSPAESEK
jgi:hypothetical protein